MRTLIIGSAVAEVAALRELLDADLLGVPALPEATDPGWGWAPMLQDWREASAGGARHSRIVVAVWPPRPRAGALLGIATGEWVERAEAALALWFAALGVAAQRAADGASVVALVEAPAPLDSENQAPEVAVADGVAALIRSLARAEGGRGVRFNAVSTPLRVSGREWVAPAPPLHSFPGTLEHEVAGAVRLLLSPDACGLTATVLRADCGRSW